jgi:hypothetical protein
MSPGKKEYEPVDPRNPFHDSVRSIYDLSSCGMGVMRYVTDKHAKGIPLTQWDSDALTTSGSNYLAKPYVLGWRRKESMFAEFGPTHFSPSSDSHLGLIETMYQEYNSLEWMWLRQAIAGDEMGLMAVDPTKPIDLTEMSIYLYSAYEKNIIEGVNIERVKKNPNIDINKDTLSLLLDIALDVKYSNNASRLFTNLLFAGVNFSELYEENYARVKASDFHKENVKKAAVHKLGAMLGITEQVLYDAQQSGTPVASTFKYDHPVLEANWQKLFGEKVPTIEDAIKESQATFFELSDPQDPVSGYLFKESVNPIQYLI